ncbi:hypothetical protein ABZY57_15000 [Streptomyces sp. NPDC006450]|uniref:hypothetical protein n=1 Tax=Streptomyces sp. NPDC006450 TaxID=3155458 RepID=UPI0033B3B4E7
MPHNRESPESEDPEQLRLVAAAQDLPPLLMPWSAVQVIEGLHRTRSAKARGLRLRTRLWRLLRGILRAR